MEIPYLAIIVAAVVQFVLGMLWYSPLLFGNQWMKLNGFTKEQIQKEQKKGMGLQMLVSLVSSLIFASVLWYLLANLSTLAGLSDALLWSALLWLGFGATGAIGAVLWEKMPIPLYFLHVGYALGSYLLMTGIVYQMALV